MPKFGVTINLFTNNLPDAVIAHALNFFLKEGVERLGGQELQVKKMKRITQKELFAWTTAQNIHVLLSSSETESPIFIIILFDNTSLRYYE